jgi:alpha-D-ribose 1-methylphosphonate 5-triphosphate diphosphatase
MAEASSAKPQAWRIVNAQSLRPEGIVAGAELATDGATIGAADHAARIFDASGLVLLPGIVDLHGDAFERQLMPRPGVFFPDDLALRDTDRQLVANGITTAFHALTWSWEPGLRGTERARSFVAALERLRPHLACDAHLHLRWELYNLEALEDALAWIETGRVALLAFNDHTPGLLKMPRDAGYPAKTVERTGLSQKAFADLLARVADHAAAIPEANAKLAAAAVKAGIALASHDDASPAIRESFRALGCRISEFPMTRETAAAARAAGEHVMMGAPNVVRGGSHLALVSAEAMVRADLCDVLASDYYYPAMLQAPWRLAGGLEELAKFWPLVSENPARAAGLGDRGTLAPGMRADMVLVDISQGPPRAVATFVAGRLVFDATGGRIRS